MQENDGMFPFGRSHALRNMEYYHALNGSIIISDHYLLQDYLQHGRCELLNMEDQCLL